MIKTAKEKEKYFKIEKLYGKNEFSSTQKFIRKQGQILVKLIIVGALQYDLIKRL